MPQHAEKVQPHNPRNTTPRSLIKNNTFQDHCLQNHHSATSVAPLQDHSAGVVLFKDHKSKCVALFQDHLSLVNIKDIFSLKNHS